MIHIIGGTEREIRQERLRLEKATGRPVACVRVEENGAWVALMMETDEKGHPAQRVAVSEGLAALFTEEPGDDGI